MGLAAGGGEVRAESAAAPVELPYLLTLPSPRVPVRYTPGTLDRASHLQRRFEFFLDEIASRSAPRFGLVIDLLSRDEWEASGIEVPYGLPASLGPREIALAAIGDAGTVALWRRLAGGGVPRLPGAPIRGTIAEAESLWALDLAAEVEIARLLLPALAADGGSPWWEPLVAQTLAWSAFLRYEPDQGPQIARFFDGLAESAAGEADMAGGAARRILDAAPFAAAARQVAASEGRPPAKRFLRWLARKGNSGGPAGREERFRERYPEVAAWLDARPRPAA